MDLPNETVNAEEPDKGAALLARIAQLADEGREHERNIAAWQLADLIMQPTHAFNPWPPRSKRLRYSVIEAI